MAIDLCSGVDRAAGIRPRSLWTQQGKWSLYQCPRQARVLKEDYIIEKTHIRFRCFAGGNNVSLNIVINLICESPVSEKLWLHKYFSNVFVNIFVIHMWLNGPLNCIIRSTVYKENDVVPVMYRPSEVWIKLAWFT